MASAGKLEAILGPMFSGKTTELFRRIKRHTAAHQKCLVIRYAKDMRYHATAASTHDREMLRATGAATLGELEDVARDYDVIGIDEGQFYPDLVEQVLDWVNNQHKVIIIAALDGDFLRKPFGRVLDLVPQCDSVTKLCAVCPFCLRDAPFTRRLDTSNQHVELIGGAEQYAAACRACYENPPVDAKERSRDYHAQLKQSIEHLEVVVH